MDEAIFQAPHKVPSLPTVPGGWEGEHFYFMKVSRGLQSEP